MITRKIRAGYYLITHNGASWDVEQRRVDAGYGGGWAWFASTHDSRYGDLDPLPTLTRVKAAIESLEA